MNGQEVMEKMLAQLEYQSVLMRTLVETASSNAADSRRKIPETLMNARNALTAVYNCYTPPNPNYGPDGRR